MPIFLCFFSDAKAQQKLKPNNKDENGCWTEFTRADVIRLRICLFLSRMGARHTPRAHPCVLQQPRVTNSSNARSCFASQDQYKKANARVFSFEWLLYLGKSSETCRAVEPLPMIHLFRLLLAFASQMSSTGCDCRYLELASDSSADTDKWLCSSMYVDSEPMHERYALIEGRRWQYFPENHARDVWTISSNLCPREHCEIWQK